MGRGTVPAVSSAAAAGRRGTGRGTVSVVSSAAAAAASRIVTGRVGRDGSPCQFDVCHAVGYLNFRGLAVCGQGGSVVADARNEEVGVMAVAVSATSSRNEHNLARSPVLLAIVQSLQAC
jgi:hypothetical protein